MTRENARKQLMHILAFLNPQLDGADVKALNMAIDALDKEPSRKGHWIIKDRYYHDTVTAECSECGREVEIPTCMSELMYKGCPYCMAEMVEPQESEDKE